MSLGRILIVDDDANLLELIKMRLESADYEVTACCEEDNAIAALKAGTFDLCIVDLMLANRDGIMLMEELRPSILKCRRLSSRRMAAFKMPWKQCVAAPTAI
jgi:DNA-binding response OmpR family regulator